MGLRFDNLGLISVVLGLNPACDYVSDALRTCSGVTYVTLCVYTFKRNLLNI